VNAIDVELTGVSKRFGSLTAVDDISLTVPRGSFFSILGPSGCGKTTTLKLISGFEQPDQGEVYIAGEKVNDLAPNKRRTNMVFQQLALFPLMTVAENVAFGLRMAHVPAPARKERVDRILAKVGLSGMERRKPAELSGGQQQRVAIARCLVLEPTVLLLDEPLGSLDLKLREHMKIQLKHLQRDIGTTFVYITHDQSEALVMSDRVAVMNHGRLLQVGAPDDLYSHPVDSFVASFVGDSNCFVGEVTRLDGSTAQIAVGPLRIRTVLHREAAIGKQLQSFIRPERLRLLSADAPVSRSSNQVPGVIREVVFDGAVVRAVVELATDVKATAMMARSSNSSLPRVGENVQVAWSPDDTLSFPV
jgi:spermidine/putrescine transport system ATP-binding protein